MRGLARPFIAGCALALSAPVVAKDTEEATSVAAWRAVDAETGKIRDVEGLEQLARDFPDSGRVRLRMLQPLIDAGEIDKVLETLEWLYDRGYVFSEVAQTQIEKLVGSVAPGRVAERLRAEAEVIAASEVIDFVISAARLVESVLHDPNDDRLIVSSVIDKAVFGHKWTETWEGYRPRNASNISGIGLSQPDGQVIWMASGRIDGSDAEDEFHGLIGLGRVGLQEFRIPTPDNASISDITVADDGRIYASDPLGGGVYRASPDAIEMEQLIPPGTFRSPQGLATSADGTKLYVSDYRYGIAVVDLATRKVSRLASDLPLILDGVDGMWRYKNELIVVQNGTSPMRIAAFELSKDGMRVVGHRILEQSNPEWTEPLSGSIDGDALIYIGNGQWDRYVDGELAEGKEALPTQIRRLPLD